MDLAGDLARMPVEHALFIPGVLLIGIVLGYIMGARAARTQAEKQRRRLRE